MQLGDRSLVRALMRELRAAIELRDDDSRTSPGRLSGVLIEYESRAADRDELFLTDSLTWPEGGVVLNEQHNRQAPIARFEPQVDGAFVRIFLQLPDTQRSRDAATLVRNGTFRGISVEFRAVRETNVNGIREIAAAQLVGAALVDTPAYASSVPQVREEAGLRRRWFFI